MLRIVTGPRGLLRTIRPSARISRRGCRLFQQSSRPGIDNRSPNRVDTDEQTRNITAEIFYDIADRVMSRRQKLDSIAELSPLYDNPFTAVRSSAVLSKETLHESIDIGDLVLTSSGQMGIVVAFAFNLKMENPVILLADRNLGTWRQSSARICIKKFIPKEVAKNVVVKTVMSRAEVPLATGLSNVLIDSDPSNPPVDAGSVHALVAPPTLTAGVCKLLRQFTIQTQRIQTNFLPFGQTIYDTLSHIDEDKVYTLYEIAAKVHEIFTGSTSGLDSPPDKEYLPSALYCAVHLILEADNIRWLQRGPGHRHYLEYVARSRRSLGMMNKAIASLRDPDNEELQSFVTKCRKLITSYRRSADVENYKRPNVQFTKADLAFIELTKQFIILKMEGRSDSTVTSLVMKLLRSIDMWDCDIFTTDIAHQFLYEIGICGRWQNLQMENRLLAGALENKTEWSRRLDSEKPSTNFAHNFKDNMEKYRFDFGDLPVYCVDSADAEEIDDGFSLEQHSDGTTWIHVHIANPTAYVSPDHAFCIEARKRVKTIYLHEASRPLLPKQFSTAVGLVSDGSGKPITALTFSARINENGEILQHYVRSSIVRNVKSVTYRDLDLAMGWDYSFEDSGYPAAYSAPLEAKLIKHTNTEKVLTTHDKDILNLCFKYSEILRRRRAQNGGQTASIPGFALKAPLDVDTISQKILDQQELRQTAANWELFKLPTVAPYVISEFMVLANSIAARFSAEHGLSQPYRLGGNENEKNYGLEIKYRQSGFSYLEFPGAFYPTAVSTSTEVGPAMDLGIKEGYVRATSPLRRYFDMVAHWQIESVIRGEQNPTFTKQELESLVNELEPIAMKHTRLERQSSKWILSQYLQYLSDHGMLRLTVLLVENNYEEGIMTGLCFEYNLVVDVQLNGRGDLKPGDFIVCREFYEADQCQGVFVLLPPPVGQDTYQF
ncbi:uncharacterized protein V1516DRAFT_617852 [Lipomyces oligophaga]|uniref:uncharacterized protein n=1 Tax=Lipomyces oligophaga TaxID=45792 RepID=UPI0034CE349D